MLISGGTGSGKTTMLNILSGYIPAWSASSPSRMRPSCSCSSRTWCASRRGRRTSKGKGEVTQRALVKNALRMRPDRIILGEVRGAEAVDMLQAMNTGHEGSMATIHANTPRDALPAGEHDRHGGAQPADQGGAPADQLGDSRDRADRA